MRARIFIGSSRESIRVARAVQQNLESSSNSNSGSENTITIESTVWDQGVFELSAYTLDSLVNALAKFDFGVFVFAPDDIAKIRDKELFVTRDNVVLELGLFIGKLGSEWNFLIVPRGANGIHMPTDLLGLSTATYDPNRTDDNIRAALQPACNIIFEAIEKLGKLRVLEDTPEIYRSNYGITIQRPYDSEQVGEECEVNGTYSAKPPSGALRLLVLSLDERRIWPQSSIPKLADGTWRGKVWLGDPGDEQLVAAAIAGQASQEWLSYYHKVGTTVRRWIPLDAPLPHDIIICTKVRTERI